MNSLPIEILTHLSYYLPPLDLSRLSCTHSHFYNLYTPLLYKKPLLQSMNQLSLFLTSIKSRQVAKYVLEMDVSSIPHRWDEFTSKHVVSIIDTCPNLNTFYLDDCKLIQDSSIIYLAEHAKHLHSLGLSGCYRVTDEGIAALISYLSHQWIILDFSKLHLVSDLSIVPLSEECQRLESIHLGGTHITELSVNALMENQYNTLLHLDISCCYKIHVSLIKEKLKSEKLDVVYDSFQIGDVDWTDSDDFDSDEEDDQSSHEDV